MINNTISHK